MSRYKLIGFKKLEDTQRLNHRFSQSPYRIACCIQPAVQIQIYYNDKNINNILTSEKLEPTNVCPFAQLPLTAHVEYLHLHLEVGLWSSDASESRVVVLQAAVSKVKNEPPSSALV